MARYWAQWEKVYERRRTPTDFNLVNRKGGEKNLADITAEDVYNQTAITYPSAYRNEMTGAFLKEVGAPDSVKPAMLFEGVKSGKMTPKQMAGMLKQMPKPKDGRMEGFQLWVNLPARHKMVAPRYQDLAASEVLARRRAA